MGGEGSGGRRQGAGRKPTLTQAAVDRSFALEPGHLAALRRYQKANGLPNAAAALRHLLATLEKGKHNGNS